MTRVAGYALMSTAILGALLALVVAEPPHAGATSIDMLQDGTVFAAYRDVAPKAVDDVERSTDGGDRDAIDRFLQSLREHSTSDAAVTAPEPARVAVFRLTLGYALVVLAVAGLVGAAMLAVGGRI